MSRSWWLRAAASLCALGLAEARPVSYPEAWTAQTFNEAGRSAALLHYTLDPRFAVGLRVEDRGDADHLFVGPQANRLLKRWNAPDAQGNLYLKLAGGAARGRFGGAEDETRAAAMAELAGDWEDRRFFVSGAARAYLTEGDAMTEQSARLGVAPYVAEYGALHSWVMVQIDHRPDRLDGKDAVSVTPLLRLFKGPVLVEAGYGTDDNALFNLTYRF